MNDQNSLLRVRGMSLSPACRNPEHFPSNDFSDAFGRHIFGPVRQFC
jgi:hypothetical protein